MKAICPKHNAVFGGLIFGKPAKWLKPCLVGQPLAKFFKPSVIGVSVGKKRDIADLKTRAARLELRQGDCHDTSPFEI